MLLHHSYNLFRITFLVCIELSTDPTDWLPRVRRKCAATQFYDRRGRTRGVIGRVTRTTVDSEHIHRIMQRSLAKSI